MNKSMKKLKKYKDIDDAPENRKIQDPEISSTTTPPSSPPPSLKRKKKKKKSLSLSLTKKKSSTSTSSDETLSSEIKNEIMKISQEADEDETKSAKVHQFGKNLEQSAIISSWRVPKFIVEPPPERKKALVVHPKAEMRWFQYADEQWLSPDADHVEVAAVKANLSAFSAYAQQLLDSDVDLYARRDQKKKRDGGWLESAASAGTRADRVAALCLLVQDSPVHSLRHLDALMSAVKKKAGQESIDTVIELMVESLLLPGRKLIPLEKRPLLRLEGSREVKDRRLLLWFFEDQLKKKYHEFLTDLQKLCQDAVEATRMKATRCLCRLLSERPEQEQFLLSAVVNKLGDSSYKVASKVCQLLLGLLDTHPDMKAVLVREVERVIYRKNISRRAQFYGVHCLSQMMLKASESEIAARLLAVYFNLFRVLVKKGEVDNRMLAVLLAGTNRAFPYAKGKMEEMLKELSTLYRVVAVAQMGVSLQTLLLLYQVLDASEGVSDRYYCALYRKLLDPGLAASSRLPQLFNLLYKSLGSDPVDKRVRAFVKRLLQLALEASAPFAAGVLLLVSKLTQEKPGLLRFHKPAEPAADWNEDDDEEHFQDVHGPDSEAEMDREEEEAKAKNPTWVHRNFSKSKSSTGYCASVRNPLFSGVERTVDYELCLLARHYHPSVSLFAQNLLDEKPIVYSGDPLQDFNLMRFLDRFAYRNPKKSSGEQKGKRILNRRKAYDPWGVKNLGVGSEEYLQKKEEEIPPDEKFLHRYLTSVSRPKKEEEESDMESVASDEFEEVLARFEPGGLNDDLDVDLSRKRRRHESDSDSEDDVDADGEMSAFSSAEQFGELLEEAGEEKRPGKKKRRVKRRKKH